LCSKDQNEKQYASAKDEPPKRDNQIWDRGGGKKKTGTKSGRGNLTGPYRFEAACRGKKFVEGAKTSKKKGSGQKEGVAKKGLFLNVAERSVRGGEVRVAQPTNQIEGAQRCERNLGKRVARGGLLKEQFYP